MSIGKLAAGREEYYLSQVADGVEDYYLASGEAPGAWTGAGNGLLGLAGEVAADDLRAVLAGRSPDGESLVRAGRRTPGFDLTFRAPKSVSLLHALGAPEVVREVTAAHDHAVAGSVAYLERYACMTRRGPAGRDVLQGDGLVAALFRHRTSRAGDPALHTHVLIANLVHAEGRWGSLDGRLIYGEAKTAAYLYQAVLRAELTRRLGVDWQPVRYGMADIAGFGRPVIEEFSRRRRQIVAELERRGERSAAAAQIATLTTRQPKQDTPRELLVADWRARAEHHGLADSAFGLMLGRASVERVGLPDVTVEELLGPHGLTHRRSSFTRRDVVQAWCNALPHGGTLATVEELTASTLRSPEILPLASSGLDARFRESLRRRDGRHVPAPATVDRFTTVEMAQAEADLVESATTRHAEGVAVVDDHVVDAALTLRPSLGPDQRHMIRGLTTSGNGIDVVVGKAGAGKTLALDAARAAWQASGVTVIGCSLAARAAAQLECDAGIPSATISRLTIELDRHPLPYGSVVVVDEAAMVGTRTLASLAQLTERAGAKLVVVGDDRQLPAIDAGGGFRALTQAVTPIRLDINRRQHHQWERVALDQIATGRAESALAAYAEHGRITVGRTAEETRDLLVADWHREQTRGDGGPMLALHRSDVDDLNHRARRQLKAAGDLVGDELEVGGRRYAVGEQVIGRRNDYRAGILNGTRATITAIQHRAKTVIVQTEAGEHLQLSHTYLASGHLDYGYALTVHKAQGATWDCAFVLGDDRLYREAGYVALSRARNTTRLYTVNADPHDEHRTLIRTEPQERLARALTRSHAEESVRELRF